MKVKALDLTKEFPRSPKEKLGDYPHLARMTDKARAKRAGTIGEYIYPCPLDQLLLDFLGIKSDAFYRVATEFDDQEVLKWVKDNAVPKTPDEIGKWNQGLLDRKPETDDAMRHFLEIRNRIAPDGTDITTWVDLLDLEEGRI